MLVALFYSASVLFDAMSGTSILHDVLSFIAQLYIASTLIPLVGIRYCDEDVTDRLNPVVNIMDTMYLHCAPIP